MQTVATKLFKIGDSVERSGLYICVPCGFTQYFEAGSYFETCMACFAGTENGPEGYQEKDSEFWEFLR